MIALFSYRADRPYLHLKVSLLLFTALSWSVGVAWAQRSEPQVASSQVHIAQDMELIRTAEQEHRPDAEQGALWAHLASEYHYAAEFSKAEDAYYKSLHLLKNAPTARAEYAATLESLAALYLIYGQVDDAERGRKQALAIREQLGDPSDIGLSHVHLADVAMMRHDFKKAERLALRGMEEMESSSKPPREGMLSGLTTLSYARCFRGHSGEGLMSARQTVAFANRNFPSDSAAVGFALQTVGFAEWKSGAIQDAGKAMLDSVRILRTTLVPADPRLAGVLLQYRDYLIATSRRTEAQEVYDEAERIIHQTVKPCAACTVSIYSLSKTLR
jgi:tetratricopeptide (TPR) repeat protein